METPVPSPHPADEPSHPQKLRCRLVLIVPGDWILQNGSNAARRLEAAFAAADVASVIVFQGTVTEPEFQKILPPVVASAQNAGVAVMVDGEPRIAARTGADGVHLGQDPDALRKAIDQYAPKMMVGAGNVRTRHNALVIGELQPDYVMFGKPGADTHEEAHPKNLALGQWWSAMVEIPCIVLGGKNIETVVDVAKTGADFVALSSAIFVPDADGKGTYATQSGGDNAIADRVRHANTLLDDHAPELEILDD